MNTIQPYRPAPYPTLPPITPSGMMPFPNDGMPQGFSPVPPNPAILVAQLGLNTRLSVDGSVQYDEPLVQTVVNLREGALPALNLLLSSTSRTATILEALHTATRMAENGVQGVETLYPVAARFNNHIDPAVQVHLARFYGKINEPKAFGPMLSTAIHYAANQYPMGSYAAYQFTEEAGAALLSQMARLTARETVRQLLPYLKPATPPMSTYTPFLNRPV